MATNRFNISKLFLHTFLKSVFVLYHYKLILNTIFYLNSFFLIEITSGNQKSSLDTTPIGNLLA